MKRSIAMKWVAALRSGKYKQGKRHLRQGNEYCCLGVLCEIMGTIKRPSFDGQTLYGFAGESGVLPSEVRAIANMRDVYGSFLNKSLTSLNDGTYLNNEDEKQSLNFDEIADLIPINWKII